MKTEMTQEESCRGFGRKFQNSGVTMQEVRATARITLSTFVVEFTITRHRNPVAWSVEALYSTTP